jgi:hypothetical protein
MTTQKTIELDYFPVRQGGIDELHSHLSPNPTGLERESCGACAQLDNDFAWLRFNDAMAGRESEFGTVEDAMKYAVVNVERKPDPRAYSALKIPDRVATAA